MTTPNLMLSDVADYNSLLCTRPWHGSWIIQAVRAWMLTPPLLRDSTASKSYKMNKGRVRVRWASTWDGQLVPYGRGCCTFATALISTLRT